jgi:putative GTP pyrophosphokinase
MGNAIKTFSRTQLSKAGLTLISQKVNVDEKNKALDLINLWRSYHAYPVNTFNATLRGRVKKISNNALVAQRLKRIPSIEKKLTKNHKMQLARMQDIGGLRAVLENISQVEKLVNLYKNTSLLESQLHSVDDYISEPKDSGYRSIHLIYKYKNSKAPDYNGYFIELQIRTKLQHAWATAIETIGSFLNQALKSSEGSDEWLDYFKYVSVAFAIIEGTSIHKSYQHLTSQEIFKKCIELEKKLEVIDQLQAYSVAAKQINSDTNKGRYHLITLNTLQKNVSISSFGQRRLEEAHIAYAEAEKKALENKHTLVVLVATDSAESLQKTYPNYFLDTKQFVKQLKKIERTYMENQIKTKLLSTII